MRLCTLTLLAGAAIFLAPTGALGQIDGLKSRIPTDANAALIINTEKLFGSPAAERGRWEAKRQAAFDAGVTFVSEKTTGVVVAAKLDVEFGNTVWELAQVRLSDAGSLPEVAARFGGEVDSISGRPAVRLPNDAIVVEVTPQNYASYTPANRQEVARWLRSTDSMDMDDRISPYLEQAFQFVQKSGTPIILALDLNQAFSEAEVRRRQQGGITESLEKSQQAQIAKTLSGIRGTMLGVTIGEAPFGSIRVDFKSDVSPLKPVGKQMVLNILKKQGAMIPEIANWEVQFGDKAMFLKGPLSEAGLRRVLSVLQLPPSLGQALDQVESSGGATEESLQRIASQQYFKSVTDLLDNLRKRPGGSDMVTPGSIAMWYSRYARKIDNLPILNVDDDLLAWGRDVSTLLRGGESALKSVGMRTAVRSGQRDAEASSGYSSYYGYTGNNYGGYGGYGGYRGGYGPSYNVGPTYQQRATEQAYGNALIRQEERVAGAAQAQQMWQVIEEQTAEIRRVMTKKYETEF